MACCDAQRAALGWAVKQREAFPDTRPDTSGGKNKLADAELHFAAVNDIDVVQHSASFLEHLGRRVERTILGVPAQFLHVQIVHSSKGGKVTQHGVQNDRVFLAHRLDHELVLRVRAELDCTTDRTHPCAVIFDGQDPQHRSRRRDYRSAAEAAGIDVHRAPRFLFQMTRFTEAVPKRERGHDGAEALHHQWQPILGGKVVQIMFRATRHALFAVHQHLHPLLEGRMVVQ
jgi:hypothetical protein